MSQKSLDDEQSLFECMEEFRLDFLASSSEDSIHHVVESWNMQARTESWCKKHKEGERMIKKREEIQSEILLLNKRIEEKQAMLLETISKIKQSEEYKVELGKEIQDLNDDLDGKRECILVKKRANKASLKELHKSATIFKERLGLDIRKVLDNKLQFVFRGIDSEDPDWPCTFILFINEQGDFELTESNPALDCVPEFQQKVRETNNISALLVNFRKAFTDLAQKEKALGMGGSSKSSA